VLFACLLAGCDARPAGNAVDDLRQWQGTWKMIATTYDGAPQAADMAWVVKGDRYFIRMNGQVNSDPYATTNGAHYTEDLGVFYASGMQLQPVTSSPAQGQYIPGTAGTGALTFAAADAGAAMLTYYGYTATTLVQLSLANQLMGTGPVFELQCKQDYFVQGVEKKLILKLNACRGSKWSLPFKNTDYTIQDFEFTAFADPSNNWGTFAFSE
jgi:hypothetical protein